MASSSGFATSLSLPKTITTMESSSSLLHPHNFSSSVPFSSSRFHKPSKALAITMASQREFVFIPKCDVASSDALVRDDKIESKAASISALEMLKTSAADRYTKDRSSVVAIGLNVHTALVEIREKLSIPEAQWPQAISELCALNHEYL